MRECNKSRSDQIMARIDDLAAERDHWRAEAEKARTPDASNPAHWRFAADLIPGDWRLRSGDTAVSGIFRREADRLESEATADDVVEKAAQVPHAVHNHGSEDGPGLACNEVRLTDGRKLGVCLLPHLRGDR
ncbi:hypothetical protein SEA_PHABULOSO_86 [Gordonia phage Phabuloso]|nr:hypothetical protein SEA_PHABULOSO_86 [Gordonia phage Phabuloso]